MIAHVVLALGIDKAVVASLQPVAITAFTIALLLMGCSLACLCYEVWISGGALRILLNAVEDRR